MTLNSIMPLPHITAVDQVSSALTLSSLRNQAIASNIANRDTAGYQRLEARFGAAFEGAAPHAFITAEKISAPSGEAPSLELDMVALSTNALQYQALARVLSRYFSIEETIANGGRS